MEDIASIPDDLMVDVKKLVYARSYGDEFNNLLEDVLQRSKQADDSFRQADTAKSVSKKPVNN